MAYKTFIPLPQMNYQINRVYSQGERACSEEELWDIAPKISEFNFDTWYREWLQLGRKAEKEGRLLHAASYYRLAEFYLHFGVPEKKTVYEDYRRCFYQAVKTHGNELFEIPYEGKSLPAVKKKAKQEKGVIILHGGFDSFMEEFYLDLDRYLENGFSVILFEGPGQGRTLREGMKMTYMWEKPVSAVIDFFQLNSVNLIGLSLGGYLALRAAAYDSRIEHVVAYGVVWDALACFMRNLPEGFYQMVYNGKKDEINTMINQARQSNDLVDWVASHGMYVTGTDNPFDYFYAAKDFHTMDLSAMIKQDVLLLAGENDHLIPVEFFQKQKDALINARSVHGRVFTAAEGGDQHCQVGNVELAINEIINWLNSFY